MTTVIITHDAKCKHCKYFQYKTLTKLNGQWSKRKFAFCENSKSEREGQPLTLKSTACNQIEL